MYNPMSLAGRRILVTGASSGIGSGCAQVLSRLGARLVLVGRNEERLQALLAEMEGEDHLAVPFDLSDIETIPVWLKDLAQTGGPLNGLVHSAGVELTRPLQIMKFSEYRELMTINLDAAVALAKGFRQRGVATRPASLVLIASVGGMVGQAGHAAYAASKGGVIALARSLALELVRDGLRVNTISPGLVETKMAAKMFSELPVAQIEKIQGMHPLGIGQVEDVAHAVAYLLADTGRWVTGSNLVVDGGYTAH